MYRQVRFNKYGNTRQTYNGYSYMSKLEANYAYELDMRLKAKQIKAWDKQHKISFDVNGKHICNYYVDFIVYHNDDTIELVECKGMETDIWKLKRRLLEVLFLPEHPEYSYTVVK